MLQHQHKEDGTKAKVEIATPMFGYNNRIGIDRAHRFIRAFTVTSAAAHDGVQLPTITTANTASDVWADTAYRSKAIEKHLADNGLRSKTHFRRQSSQDLTPS